MNLMEFLVLYFYKYNIKFYFKLWQKSNDHINDIFLDILNFYLLKDISYLTMIIISCIFTNKI